MSLLPACAELRFLIELALFACGWSLAACAELRYWY